MMDTFNILPKYIEFWLKVINYFCLNEIMVGDIYIYIFFPPSLGKPMKRKGVN